MSDYYYYDIDSFDSTTIDDDFIGGSVILIIGALSLVVIILLLIAIRIFSRKLNTIDCDEPYPNYREPVEEIEPLPLYEERDSRPEVEIDLSDYIQANNTINTIPRDTMIIINRLSTNNDDSDHDDHSSNDNNNYNMSTLPLPIPKKENMPCIPPPCYDIALTQPRINNQGMIVLPQDPTFNQPILTRSTRRHSLRRSRQRFMRFFSHFHPSFSINYRLPTRSSSMLSCSSASSESNVTLNQYHRIHSNSSISDIHNNNTVNRRGNNIGRLRTIFIFSRHGHNRNHTSSSSRRYRRLLRFCHSTDNASISSISICPTTSIEVPEDHYSINHNTSFEVRRHHSISNTNPNPITTMSMSRKPLLSNDTNETNKTNEANETNETNDEISSSSSPQNDSSEETNHSDTWMNITQYQLTSESEFVHMDSGVSINSNLNNMASSSNTSPFNSSEYVNINMDANPSDTDCHQITISNDYLNINNNIQNNDINGEEDFHNSVINLVAF